MFSSFLANAPLFPVRLSLQVAFMATGVLILITIPISYIFARYKFYGKAFLDILLSLPLVLPPTVLGYYLVCLFGKRGIIGHITYNFFGWTPMFTWWGAVIASIVVAFPLLFKTATSALSSVDRELEHAAYTLGHSKWSTFWRVTLPLAKKGILAGIVLAFARAMGEFGATLMLAGNIPGKTSTMPLAIYNEFIAGRLTAANFLVAIHTTIAIVVLWFVRDKNNKSDRSLC